MTTIVWTMLGATLCLCLLLLLVSGRAGDTLYLALRHYKATLFVMLCLSVGISAGMNIRNMGDRLPIVDMAAIPLPAIDAFSQRSAQKTLATIRNCQAFVTAHLEQASHVPPVTASPALLHLASDGLPPLSNPSKDWDRCARAFGTNYWKVDISVKGENGGIALCRAYHAQDGYRSGTVDAWCDTVFRETPTPPTH